MTISKAFGQKIKSSQFNGKHKSKCFINNFYSHQAEDFGMFFLDQLYFFDIFNKLYFDCIWK